MYVSLLLMVGVLLQNLTYLRCQLYVLLQLFILGPILFFLYNKVESVDYFQNSRYQSVGIYSQQNLHCTLNTCRVLAHNAHDHYLMSCIP